MISRRLAAAIASAALAAAALAGFAAATSSGTPAAPAASVVWNAKPAPGAVSWG